MKRFLEYDAMNGITTYFDTDAQGKDWTFHYEAEDVGYTLDASKQLAANHDHWNQGVKNDMVHYAHIPNAILLQWYSQGVDINDPRELIRMTNRREWRYLKNTEKVHLAK